MLGFEVDARDGVVRMEGRRVDKGLRLRDEIFEARPGTTTQARDLLASVSFLNFLRWVFPGGFCHLRSGWGAVNESGAMGQWGAGVKRAPAVAAVTEDPRNDMVWWRKMLPTRPAKRLQFG